MKRINFSLLLLLITNVLFAWGPNGHRIVAQICYDNLSDNARKNVDILLGDNYLAQIATWPDYIRSEKDWDFTKPWHFITIDSNKTVAQVIKEGKKNPAIQNTVEAIEFMKLILEGDKDATKQFTDSLAANDVKPLEGSVELTALSFLVHFIGDVHQPMHVGKNNDFGGNKIIVLFFDEKTNLHSVWDEGIIEQEQLSFSEFAMFVNRHESPNKTTLQKKGLQTWVEESVVDREKIYNTLYDITDETTGLPYMKYLYQHNFLPVVEYRLGAAGYRAAAVLNSIFN